MLTINTSYFHRICGINFKKVIKKILNKSIIINTISKEISKTINDERLDFGGKTLRI